MSRAFELLAPYLGFFRPKLDLARKQGFEPPAQRLRQFGRATTRRDADDKWRPVDDRAELKIRKCGRVDDIDRDASGACSSLKPGSVSGTLRFGDRERGAVKILGLNSARNKGNIGAAAGERHKTRTEGCTEYFQACPRRLAELGLPENRVGAARENHFFATERKKYRQAGKVPHQRTGLLFHLLFHLLG